MKKNRTGCLYVALTRAEEHLILSWSRKADAKPTNWAKLVSGRFDMDAVAASGEPDIATIDTFQVRRVRSGQSMTSQSVTAAAEPAREPFDSGTAVSHRSVSIRTRQQPRSRNSPSARANIISAITSAGTAILCGLA